MADASRSRHSRLRPPSHVKGTSPQLTSHVRGTSPHITGLSAFAPSLEGSRLPAPQIRMASRSSPTRSIDQNSTFVIEETAGEASIGSNSCDSSLSKSLKFLEASHLLSDEEMISMGCQPPTRSATDSLTPDSGPLELSNASSLLTESLLNASFGAPLTSTCEKTARPRQGCPAEPADLFDAISESPISCDADPGNESEVDNATYSLKSHELDSTAENLEASLNSEPAGEEASHPASSEMEVLEKLSERSLSEPDLTMRGEEAAEEVSGDLTSSALAKKKRTRSPTPSSAKTESVPAKRSLTQRPRPSTARPSTASTASTAARRGSGLATARQSTASSTSVAEKPGGVRRSTAGPGAKKGPETTPGAPTSTSRRASMPLGARGATTAPRRSIAGAPAEAETKKYTARQASTLTRPTAASSRREKSSEPAAAASASASTSVSASTSRLKAPSLLQRTFSKKGGAASPGPASPRGTVGRASASGPSGAPAGGPRKDSQLQPAKGAKPTRPATAASERATGPAAGKTQPDGRLKPSAGRPTRSTLSSNSSDVRSSSNRKLKGCSSPDAELRAQLTSQAAQLTSQEAQLTSQVAQLSAQEAQLSAQESRLAELGQRCAAQEEALCAGRSRLEEAVHAFSAMAVVCQAMDRRAAEATNAKEQLQRQLQEVIEQTKEVAAQCESLIREKEALKAEMTKEADNFRQKMAELTTSHRTALQSERNRLEKDREAEIGRVIDQHSAEVKTLKQFHEKELDRSRMHFEALMHDMKTKHATDLQEISRRDEKHLEELQNQHEKRIAEITQRFEDMKVTLSNRIQVLHVECNELRSRSFEEHEHVRRHSDVKLQAAIQQFQHLPEENASLKAVLDLRINENAELRRQNTELQEKVRDLEEVRLKSDQLARQNENLEAIISLKSDNEKQLQERHQSLLRRFERESKEKKRLSMGYEELLYKLEECQSSEDLTKRSLSDIPSMTSSAVVMRSHAPSRPKPRGLQHDRSKRKTIASSRELD